jgi:hypothetical protein
MPLLRETRELPRVKPVGRADRSQGSPIARAVSAPGRPPREATSGNPEPPQDGRRWHWALSHLLGLTLLLIAGCTRGRYYVQADREVSTLLAEKSCDPRWAVPASYNVRQDERSRFYDAYNQVFPPMPPDDPTAHRYMHCVDGKKGWPRWHAHGDRTTLDNPDWRERLHEVAPITASGALVLDLPSAVRLAYLNSVDWQDQLETLYLSALDVSTERFRFDVQFYGYPGNTPNNTTAYANRGPLSPRGESTTWTTDTTLRAQKYFATAGTAVIGMLNSIVWQFAGPDRYSNVSLLNFNLVQPLLRRAGRSIAMEPLTIVERALLANLRRLQFYRQGFFLQVAVGGNAPPGLQRRGGFFGGTGFTGFTGTGVGGFGNIGGVFFGGNGVGLQVGGGGSGGAGFAGGGAGNIGGFLGLLQARQQIRNAEQNLSSQERALALLDANLEAGLVGLEQVDQLRQSVETNRAGLLQAKTSLANQIENFKVNILCLPSDTQVAVDEEFIKPFQFISPAMQALQNRLGDFLARYSFGAEEPLKETEDPRQDPSAAEASEELPPPADRGGAAAETKSVDAGLPAEPAAALPAPELQTAPATELLEQEMDRSLIAASLDRLQELRTTVEEQAAEVAADLARVPTAAAGRLAGMRPTDRETFGREMRLLEDDLDQLVESTRSAERAIAELAAGLSEENRRQTADEIVKLIAAISGAVDEMSLIQARARVEAITIDLEPLDPDVAFEIARANRLDWMNNRSALVDQWRLIQYNANSLLAGVDIVVDGDISTVGNDPARFRAPTGAMSAGVRLDPPLTRLIERNNFRQAILDYQQVRREQIRYEDRVKLAIRQSLRQLELDQRNLETQRRAVIIAIRRVDQTRLTLSQPAPPPPPSGPDGLLLLDAPAGQLAPTATLNLIFAFNDLRSAQDALTSIWVNYYATRASLAQQLGVMALDEDGLWIDQPFSLADRSLDEEVPLPPPVPPEWLEHLEEVGAPPPLPADEAEAEPARRPDVEARPVPAARGQRAADSGNETPQAESGSPASAPRAGERQPVGENLRLPGFSSAVE